MSPTLLLSIRYALAAVLAGLLTACASPRQSADDLLARASQTMGATQLKTLRYGGEGTGFTFGQAFRPGEAWPRITVHSMTRTIDYDGAAMREEIVLSRAEPLGGGGYPLSGQQRNDQYLSGTIAWNQTGTAVMPGPRFVTERLHQLWITPHGALKAAARNGAVGRRNADGSGTVTFTEPGRFKASVVIGADGLVSQIESTVADPVLGDTPAVTTYSGWRDVGGVKFPGRIRQSMGGFPVLDLTVSDVQANPAVALPVPEAARNQGEQVSVEKVADGVWFLAGGSHNSVAIELADQLVLVEAPLNDARTLAVIERARQLAPGKPIRQVVNSHAHFDHAGGVRAAVGEGATIVTQAANVPYFERVFAQANSLRPDRLAQSGRKPSFRAVTDRLALGDASRPIELHRIVGGPHNDSFLLVYLPRERLLIEADAYTPSAPNTPPPAAPNLNNVNLIETIERLGLAVDRILPLHGRIVAVSELYTTAGRTPPR